MHEKRLVCMSLMAMLFLVLLRARDAAGEEIQQPVAPGAPAGETIPLPLLVRDALRDNLTLRTVVASTLSVETSVQAESSTFDPLFQLLPFYSRPEQQRLDAESGAIVTGSQPNGRVSSSFGGILPSSTSYSIDLSLGLAEPDQPGVSAGLSFSLRQLRAQLLPDPAVAARARTEHRRRASRPGAHGFAIGAGSPRSRGGGDDHGRGERVLVPRSGRGGGAYRPRFP